MAAEKRNQYYSENRRRAGDAELYRTRLYVDGNTVRRDEDYEVRRHTGKNGEVSHKVRKNREKARFMTAPYVLMLMAATALAVVICYQYLAVQSSIANHKNRINELQSSISALQQANDAAEDSIEIYTDLDYIYSVATTELGMVYPSEDQVIEYDKSESEFVRQYDDIPTAD